LVDVATKNGRPLEPLSSSPKKTGTVSPSAVVAETEAAIGENGDGEGEDEALPPKKRKKIQINRDAVSTDVATDSESIPASAAEPATKAPEVASPAKKHTPITAPESDGPKEKVVKLSAEALAATDKAKLRQEKFGAVTKDDPSKTKAATPAAAAGAVISEKAKKRLEKFGGPATVATVGKVSVSYCLF